MSEPEVTTTAANVEELIKAITGMSPWLRDQLLASGRARPEGD